MIESFNNEESFLSNEDIGVINVEEITGEFGQPCYRIVEIVGDELNDRFEIGEVLNDTMIDDLLDSEVEISIMECAETS